MIIDVDSLSITRFDGSIYCRLEIFPPGIAKNALEISREPYFDLLFPIIAFNVGCYRIKSRFVLYDTLFVHITKS